MTETEFLQRMKQIYPEIISYVRRKKLLKLFRVILIDGLLLGITLLTLQQMKKPQIVLPTMLAVGLICAVWTYSSKPKGLLFAKPYVGVIERTTVETRVVNHETNIRRATMKNILVLSIRAENGKLYCVLLDPKYEPYYRMGDRVGVLPAIPYPFLIDAPQDRKTVCWWCGSINAIEDRECLMCGRARFES